ncbi:MAG: GHKL domain-containing protein, partial [Sphingobacteriales bacterium]
LQFPIVIQQSKPFLESMVKSELMYGFFYGILILMIIYNFLIYFPLRDKSYLNYTFSILSTLGFFATLNGHTSQYIFPQNPLLANYFLLLSLSGMLTFSSLFTKSFLQTKNYTPILTKVHNVMIGAGILGAILTPLVDYMILLRILSIMAVVTSISILVSSFICWKRGSTSAQYFVFAWGVYLIGSILLVLQIFDFLPSSFFTTQSVEIGSVLQVVILFFALGKRYRKLKQEKEVAQKEIILIQENIKTELEQKVIERTRELEDSLDDIKKAQSQLIQAEKMASLGTLTAGVAHEINNPINFISGGIGALKANYSDLESVLHETLTIENDENLEGHILRINKLVKDNAIIEIMPEMNELFSSVNNGAERVTEIVKGLSTFSRTDQNNKKLADIEEGIDSTLRLLNAKLRDEIKIIKNYANVPEILCFPGQINQVFMNLLSNAIDAIPGEGEIHISTSEKMLHVVIEIQDSGKGMPENVASKIFEPFFTTKEVGKGTGLGLSISYGIIEKHNGKIEVESKVDVGTKFTITLPKSTD